MTHSFPRLSETPLSLERRCLVTVRTATCDMLVVDLRAQPGHGPSPVECLLRLVGAVPPHRRTRPQRRDVLAARARPHRGAGAGLRECHVTMAFPGQFCSQSHQHVACKSITYLCLIYRFTVNCSQVHLHCLLGNLNLNLISKALLVLQW